MTFTNPSSISGLLLWLDASQITGKVDGDPIASWTDLSGGSRHATNAASGERPVYKTGILNGKPVVRFDGSNDYLKSTVAGDATTTLVAVLKKRTGATPTSQVGLSFGTPGSGAFNFFTNETYDDLYVYYPNDGWGVSTGLGGFPIDAQIVALRLNSTSSMDVFTNGGAVPVNVDPQDDIALFNVLAVGAAYDGTQAGDFDVAEVCMYDSSLGSGDMHDLFAYLATKWAVVGPKVLAPANTTSAQVAGAVALTQHNVLAVQNASSAHTAGNVTTSTLAVYATNASSASSSGNVTLTPSFIPTTLSGLLVWLDASQIAGHSDGDALSQWDDLSGGARHAIQATVANRPLYKTSVLNSKPVVRFDGINDSVSAAVSDNASITVVAVLRKRTAVGLANADPLALSEPNAGSHHLGTNGSVGSGFLWYPNDTFAADAIGGTPTTAQIVALRLNSTSSLDLFVGGATTVALNTNPQDFIGGFTALVLGANAYGADNGDFDFAEVCLYNSALSGSNLTSLFGYLASKWLVATAAAVPLVVANASSGSASTSVAVTQHNVLAVDDASSAHAVQNVATRFSIGAVDNGRSQVSSTSAGVLTPHFVVAVDSSSHGLSSTNCALILHGVAQLVVASAMSMMAVDACRLGVGLVLANCTMASRSSNPSGFLLHPRAPSGYTSVTGDGVRDSTEAVSKTKVT